MQVQRKKTATKAYPPSRSVPSDESLWPALERIMRARELGLTKTIIAVDQRRLSSVIRQLMARGYDVQVDSNQMLVVQW